MSGQGHQQYRCESIEEANAKGSAAVTARRKSCNLVFLSLREMRAPGLKGDDYDCCDPRKRSLNSCVEAMVMATSNYNSEGRTRGRRR